MGCACKKKLNLPEETDNKKPTNLLTRIIEFILQVCFGFVCSFLILVLIIPMLLYIFISLMLGKQASFNVNKLVKFLKKE